MLRSNYTWKLLGLSKHHKASPALCRSLPFYPLIIIYSRLTLGRNGAMIAAALCAVLYSGLISTTRLGLISFDSPRMERETLAFRISFHALGFFALAFR